MKKIVRALIFMIFLTPALAQASTGLQADEPFFRIIAFNSNPTIKIFPNPASEYIELTENDKVSKLLVFNLVGKEIKRFEAANGQRYNISDLPKGLYLVQLVDKGGQTIVTQRVSKR